VRLAACALIAAGLATGLHAPSAAAQDRPAVEVAADAYDAGVQAHRQKEYARAASLFAKADELAPDPAARLASLKSALLADDPVLAMSLADRAARLGPFEGQVADAVAAVRDKFEPRVGRIRIRCTSCTASIDSEPVAPGREILVTRGEHVVEMTAGGNVERRVVRIDASATVELSPAASRLAGVAAPPPVAEQPAPVAPPAPPAPGPRPDSARESGLSPVWLIVAAGVTVVAGGLTIASGVDVRNREHDFYRAPTQQKADDGQAAETRTYILGAVTGAAGLATAALGVFAVRWTWD
jgi:hypothetical protein